MRQLSPRQLRLERQIFSFECESGRMLKPCQGGRRTLLEESSAPKTDENLPWVLIFDYSPNHRMSTASARTNTEVPR